MAGTVTAGASPAAAHPLAATELADLNRLSAAIGSDIGLIQGPGGNTSIKAAGVLYVKASGTWLGAAEQQSIMVALDLPELHRRMAAGEAAGMLPGLPLPGTANNLRPSIETVLHGFMPHRVVLHVHSVNTIAHVVAARGEDAVRPLLAGHDWTWVPYARPGAPLLDAVIAAAGERASDVLLLANHGLVVGADTVDAAATLLGEVEAHLALPARAAPPADLSALHSLATTTGYRLPGDPFCHAIAIDPVSLRHAGAGSLYPDHVVFLGPGATPRVTGDTFATWITARRSAGEPEPPLVLIERQGVLLRADLGAAAEEMVRCLARVLARLPADADLVTLSDGDEAELMGWDAEAYRRRFDRRPPVPSA